jgi:hypothetical protein
MQGLHLAIAMRRNEPHWMLTDGDAKIYGQACANVARHFSLGASQKAVDFLALMVVGTNMESPRIYASMRAARARRNPSPQQRTAEVFQFRQPDPAPAPSAPTPETPPPPAGQQPSGLGVEGFAVDGIDGPLGGH